MSEEEVIRPKLTNKQVESWIVGNNSDGLLDDQMDIFCPIIRMEDEDQVYYKKPSDIWHAFTYTINEWGESIWVVNVTMHPIED